ELWVRKLIEGDIVQFIYIGYAESLSIDELQRSGFGWVVDQRNTRTATGLNLVIKVVTKPCIEDQRVGYGELILQICSKRERLSLVSEVDHWRIYVVVVLILTQIVAIITPHG